MVAASPLTRVAAVLTLAAFTTAAQAEDIQGYLSELGEADAPVFSSRNHPKSPGLTVELKYPKSWRAAEGKRPSILQKFQSKGGQGLITMMINVVPVPPEAGSAREMAEELKNFNEEEAAALLPAGAKLLTLEQTKLDGEPCAIMEFEHTASNAGINMEMRGLQFFAVVGEHMFTMTGTVAKSAQLNAAQFDRQWELVKLLIKAIAGNVYFPDKWKLENAPKNQTTGAQQAAGTGFRLAAKDFGFAATFPDKVEPLVMPYKMGRMGTFQALDTNNNLLVMVTANFMPASGLLVASKESTPKQLIEAMVVRNAEEKSALEGSLKTTWSTLHGKPALDFSYTTDSFAPEGLRSYHVGRTSFDVDTFYHLQVVAFEEDSKAQEELDKLAQSFSFSAE
jgi:hypothetical protein